MPTRITFAAALSLCFALTGCGTLPMPMIERLDDNTQAQTDQLWDRATTPNDRLNRQGMLDVILIGQLHHRGVDKASYRSEKAIAGGSVVMEMTFDRAKSDADRFEVTLLDDRAKVVRREKYTRDDIEQAFADLHANLPEQAFDADGNPLPEPPDIAARREDLRLRMLPLEELANEIRTP